MALNSASTTAGFRAEQHATFYALTITIQEPCRAYLPDVYLVGWKELGLRIMSQDTAPPELRVDNDTEVHELLRRSPHPYLRHRDQIRKQSPERRLDPVLHKKTPYELADDTMYDDDGRKRRKPASHSPSDSGTEADDEGCSLVKALPAPPLRLHKGLRDPRAYGPDGWATPLLTPSQIDDEGRKFSDRYFNSSNKGTRKEDTSHTDKEARGARQKYLQRRRNELLRRTTEAALLAGIVVLAVNGCECWTRLLSWHRVLAVVLGLYPLRLLYYSWRNHSRLELGQRIHLPAAFDPATILYPPVLPVLIAVSLYPSSPKFLLSNLLLGLAALPARVIPFKSSVLGYSPLHWLISILPLIAAENTDIPSRPLALEPCMLKLPLPYLGLDRELLVTLFPLHQALLPPLHYLTTTSLLPTELQLLSIGLINLFLFSDSPQATILTVLLWLGGLSVFVFCGRVLKWGVTLARIPRWRFQRAGKVIRARLTFLQVLNQSLGSKHSGNGFRGKMSDSDADDDDAISERRLYKTNSLKISTHDSVRGSKESKGTEPLSAVEAAKPGLLNLHGNTEESQIVGRKRSNTFPMLTAEDHKSEHARRKRTTSIAQSYLSLTHSEATKRKWLYAGYFYVFAVGLILGPMRYFISHYALHHHEPFGWAIGYLFGNAASVRWKVFLWNLNWWVPLPARLDAEVISNYEQELPVVQYVRQVVLGEANTRLVLCIYCAGTILLGLISVFSLSAVVEVDTRRKVFHGTMVAMLLPTMFVDPCFVALALALVLAIFILLDLIRASQLPPLSKPIARFLTPYVDGRDLRGPVVVSHMFLLIGCAIPLWLSLAGIERTGEAPWKGWDVEERDVSMVAGVVCVGMGDAAASLVGRRYGRHKWPWAGGKSLEGSIAFAVAVTVGLVFGKTWLWVGWGHAAQPASGWALTTAVTVGKAALCAAGASLNEAVLTGGNDNVIVPVILWVLVRGVVRPASGCEARAANMATPPTHPHPPRRSGASPSSAAAAAAPAEHIIGKFKRMHHIGKGSFAEVYRGIHIEKRQSVAIKSVNMNKLNKKLKDNLVSEITILRSLHHPHIVSLIDCQEAPSRMHIIMEFCELGDLSAFIKKRTDLVNHPQTQRMIEKYPNPSVGGLNEVVVRHFAKQMASALEFLRSKNYIHRDLKPQNLLLNPSSMFYSQSGTLERMPLAASANSLIPATGIASLPMLKIADFGFARILPTTSLAETLCGSPLYMAPEILRYEKYDAKADLWSVGTVLFEMMCARPPFRANNHVELLRKIEERKDQVRFPEGLVCSRAMKNLIRALLKRKPTERMSYESFFSDPVIREEIPNMVDEDLPGSMQASERMQVSALEPPVEPSRRAQKAPIDVDRRAPDSPYSQSPRSRTGFGTTPPPQPRSRPVSGNFSGLSQQPISARRSSNAAIEPSEERTPHREQRRPTLTNAATAPVRTATLQEQVAPATAITHRRKYSRDDQIPPPTGLKEHLDRERIPQRTEANVLREAAERAAQDNALDEGFVFVEKRRVEIDALADEIANSPQTQRDRPLNRETAMKRRSTTQGSPTSTTGAVPSKAIQIQQKPTITHQRTGSYSRRQYRPSFETATSALSKAMNMVNIRGLGLSPPVMKGVSPPQGYSAFPAYPTAQSSMLLVSDGGKTVSKDDDTMTVKRIEDLAQLSHVVYGFAEVKYSQLVPVAPSDPALGAGPTGVARKPSSDVIEDDDDDDDDDLTPDTVLIISEEALVLFVKTLAMLNKAMDLTGSYWNRTRRNSGPDGTNRTNAKLGQVVSWMRDRFNECCVKSEIVARKLKQAQQQLPGDHPSHPQNLSAASGSATAVGSAENILLTTGVTAEKLLYDRSLEMSRQAAIDELTGHNLADCEINYWTAITMLQAVLEEEEDSPSDKVDGEEINGLDGEDRRSIQKLLEQMRSRQRALKKKLDILKTQKRASVTSAHVASPHSMGRNSPSQQGATK
ncbi:Serine threonine- kinase atg1 [Pyrenophora seminiperda CCB06]|uniref:Serine/threonine-protein kinase ATG1 n=1 Tax=Pyrenophora seminiperda CCB06 TaxID=1302712 RepID=A0A3M7MH51_9PLEO|nr:Serine threonine- kinase atg1 [Pyrenophora seminiperda CCB06]